MFSSAHRETHLVRLRAELAATQEEARRLNSEFHQAASSERPGAELAAALIVVCICCICCKDKKKTPAADPSSGVEIKSSV